MKLLDTIALVLLVIGGLNWGLVGVADFDLVASLFGKMSGFSRLIYTVVGLAAVYHILNWNAQKKKK